MVISAEPHVVIVDRFVRQAGLIRPELQHAEVQIIGCGMLGSWAAQVFARCASIVELHDFDVVGPENIGTQSFAEHQIGMNKAEALAQTLPHDANIIAVPEKFTAQSPLLPGDDLKSVVVVSAVDSFKARKMVAQSALDHGATLFVDLRAHGTVAVLCLVPPSGLPEYIRTLESDRTAPPAACGLEGTSFVGLWLAGMLGGQVNKFFAGMPTYAKLVYDTGMGIELHAEMNEGRGSLQS